MFTVENDTDNGEGSTITTLDETNQHDDVEVILYEDSVYIRQISDEYESIQMIVLSPQQFKDIVLAYNLPDGAYYQSTSIRMD